MNYLVFDYDGVLSRGQTKADQIKYEDKAFEYLNNLKGQGKMLFCCSSNKAVLRELKRMQIDKLFYRIAYCEDRTKGEVIKDWRSGMRSKDTWVLYDDNEINNPYDPDIKFMHKPLGLFD